MKDAKTIDMEEAPGLVKARPARLRIDTSIRVGIESFVNNPAGREALLTSYAKGMAKAAGRKGLPVRIVEMSAGHDVGLTDKYIAVSKDYIERMLAWAKGDEETGGVDKGESAVFGTLARVTAKRTGSDVPHQAKTALWRGLKGVREPSKAWEALSTAIVDSLASYVVTALGIKAIQAEWPGLRGAIAASFIANAQCVEPAEVFLSPDENERWRAAWSTLIMELLTPDAVPNEVYPDEETRDTIRLTAEHIQRALQLDLPTPPAYADRVLLEKATATLARLFPEPPEGDGDGDGEDQESEGGEGSAPTAPMNAALATDNSHTGLAPDPGEGGKGRERLLDTGKHIRDRVFGPVIKESPLTTSLRNWLVDTRLEQYAGQHTGRVGAQMHRFLTDGRMFSKRMRVPEAPNACVVVCVDYSGSMGGLGYEYSNMHKAAMLHDALIYSLDQLDIPHASCAYTGDDAHLEEVYPLNLVGDAVPRSAFVPEQRRWRCGNGDVAAMLWSTKVIEESGCASGAVVFLADGAFTTTNSEQFRADAKRLDLSVFHVDYINHKDSPFGGGHIKAAGKTIEEVAEPLAQGLARALDL